MSPLRGLSMSDIRSRDIARATGKIRRTAALLSVRTKTDQEIAEDGNDYHQHPSRGGNAVPPRGLRVPLRVQYVVHASEDERGYGGRLDSGGSSDRRPHLVLQASSFGLDLPEFFSVAILVFSYALVEVTL